MLPDSWHGALVVDKPAGWTSHDVVAKVRGIFHTKKVGHLGTLDPLATGVLPLVLGRGTRLAQFYQANQKVYDAIIQFGYTTNTYDREGEPLTPITATPVERAQLEVAFAAFRGEIEQVPPAVSAKKINGVRAYRLARRNEEVHLPTERVTISQLDLLALDGAIARLLVHCTAGTYIRSLAHDLGQRLGTGAVLNELRRLRSGDFTIEQSHTLEELQRLKAENGLADALLPLAALLPEIPAAPVDLPTAAQIRQGRDFRTSPFRTSSPSQFVRALDPDGELVAIGEARLPNLYHPVCVI